MLFIMAYTSHMIMASIWRENMTRTFVRGHELFRGVNSFPRGKLKETSELRETDNVERQISEHIFAENGSYCFYYPSNSFRNTSSFENWGIYKQ